jgi:hypothetical protein
LPSAVGAVSVTDNPEKEGQRLLPRLTAGIGLQKAPWRPSFIGLACSSNVEPSRQEPGTGRIGRGCAHLRGPLYVLFELTFLYAIGFVGNIIVPKDLGAGSGLRDADGRQSLQRNKPLMLRLATAKFPEHLLGRRFRAPQIEGPNSATRSLTV